MPDRQYQDTHEGYVILLPDTKIARSMDNQDYIDYLAWVESGGIPFPPDPQPIDTPETVTMRQARLALLGAGLLGTVNAAVAAIPGVEGEAARIEWEYAQEVRRDSPLVSGLSVALGLTSEQLDALFVAGAGAAL